MANVIVPHQRVVAFRAGPAPLLLQKPLLTLAGFDPPETRSNVLTPVGGEVGELPVIGAGVIVGALGAVFDAASILAGLEGTFLAVRPPLFVGAGATVTLYLIRRNSVPLRHLFEKGTAVPLRPVDVACAAVNATATEQPSIDHESKTAARRLNSSPAGND